MTARTLRFRLLAIGLPGLLLCCNGTPLTPTDFCDQLARTMCERLYGCSSGSALDLVKAKYGDTVDQCVAFEQGELACANTTCSTGSFSSDSANSCLTALNAETCEGIAGGDAPTICGQVCVGTATPTPDAGQPSASQPTAAVSTSGTCGPIVNWGDPTVDGDNIENGQSVDSGTASVICSVVPSASGNYHVMAQAVISNSNAAIVINTTFTGMSSQSGIEVDFIPPNGSSYLASDCSITYPSKGGIKTSGSYGAVWANFSCPTQKGCTIQGAFRFENCSSL
jgi:hypothetical protein